MSKPPSLTQVLHYPVTAYIAVAAMVVTGMWWSGQEIDWAVMNGKVWSKWELWRALTSTLPHANFFHLAFNLYWWWVFGTFIERVYGHAKFAGIVVLLALSSSCAEFMLLNGGVGLSGVGYGLWGLLWVLERRDPRFAGAVDGETSQVFVVWFFVCIGLTLTDVMPVANLAHGVGAGTGVLLGLAVSRTGRVRLSSGAGLVAVLILGLVGSTVLWPWVNQSRYAEEMIEREGLDELEHGDKTKGVRFLEIASRTKGAPARVWMNLGIGYQELGRKTDALAAYEQAAKLPDATSEMQKAAQAMKAYLKFFPEKKGK